MALDISARIKRTIRRVWSTAKYLTLSPREFFFDRMSNYGIRNELILVIVIGFVGFLGWAYAARVLIDPFATGPVLPGETVQQIPTDVHYRVWGTAMFQSFGQVLAVWILYTLVTYVVSWFYSDRGSVFGLAKNLAWSLYPLVYAYLVMTIGLVLTFWTLGEVETELPIATDAAAAYLYDQGLNEPLMILTMLAMIPFIVWTGYLASFAIEKVRQLSSSNARKVAAIPTAIYAGYVLWTIAPRVGLL